jgi:hypothetical protein
MSSRSPRPHSPSDFSFLLLHLSLAVPDEGAAPVAMNHHSFLSRAALVASVSLLGVSFSPDAEASPWVLRPGRIAMSAGAYYQYANSEFYAERSVNQGRFGEVPFSLRGQFHSGTTFLGLRAGVTDRFEFELNVPLRVVSYTADPVVLLPRPMDFMGNEADYYRQNIINLSRATAGVADINLALRYQLLNSSPFVLAAEVRFKMPTGYDPPQGTFGNQPQSNADFLARAGELIRPENLRDDVTLGDGQLDVVPSLLAGLGLRSGTFLRLDLGFVGRFAGAGQAVTGSFRVGQSVGRTFVFYGGVNGLYSVSQGRVIGVSVAAIDPTLPANQYGRDNNPLFNLLLREVRLDRDALDATAGMIIRLTSSSEFNLSYTRTLIGRNTSVTNTFALAVSANTDWGSITTGRPSR